MDSSEVIGAFLGYVVIPLIVGSVAAFGIMMLGTWIGPIISANLGKILLILVMMGSVWLYRALKP